jgi:hypothetical protein
MTDQVPAFDRIDGSLCKARQVLDNDVVFGFRHNRRVYRFTHPFTHY